MSETTEKKNELSKEQRDFIVNKKTIELMNYIQEYNYLVIDFEHNIQLYKSTRDIEKDINVSHSGIAKKLKKSNYCICVEKKSTKVYYIQNINSDI